MIVNTKEEFLSEIKEGTVLVDFFATWCGPCKMMAVVLEQLDSKIKVVKVDVDKLDDVARSYGIMSIPTLILYKDGELIKKNVGFMDKNAILSWIEEK